MTNLVEKYLQKTHQPIIDLPFEEDLAKALTQEEVTGLKSISELKSPLNAGDTLRFLMKSTPSASQCKNKIVASILSEGIRLVPTKQDPDEKQKELIVNSFREWDITGQCAKLIEDRLTFGDGYWYPVFDESGKNLVDLVALDADKIKIHVDKEVLSQSGIYKPVMYEYRITDGVAKNQKGTTNEDGSVYFDKDELVRWKRPGADPVYGNGVLEDEQSTIIFGIKILAHNLRFFENSAKPPLIIHLSKDTTSQEARRYKEYLNKNYKGTNRAWETLVSYGDTKFQQLRLPDQTSFMDFLTYVRIQVCGLFGVPPVEVGVNDDAGRDNSETQHKDFIKTNINSGKDAISDLINYEILKKRMGITDWEVYLPMMDAVNEKQRIELNALGIVTGQMSINEARKRNGSKALNEPWADIPVAGDPRRVPGFMPLDKMIFGNQISDVEPVDDTIDSGRPDLDGRDREAGESMND